MNKPTILTDKQIAELAYKIGKPIYKYITKRFIKELNSFPNAREMDLNSFITLVVITMTSVDKNMLTFLRTLYKERTKTEIDFTKLILNYIYNIESLTSLKTQEYREKMN